MFVLAARRLLRTRTARIGMIIVIALVAFALCGPFVAQHHPNANDFSLTREVNGAPPGPSVAHWLGVDALHRDVFARLAYGARTSLGIAVLATIIATSIGTLVGVVAGYAAFARVRSVDAVLSRAVDILLALPFLLVITAIGAAVGRSDWITVLLVLGLSGWGGTARLIRAKTMQICALDFVAASQALGGPASWIVLRHVLPNARGIIVVMATTSIGQMLLAEAVLGYLSLGVPPPDASWGRMLHEAEPFLSTRPGLVAAPSIAILLSVMAFGRLGDALRDSLDDEPRRTVSRTNRIPVDLLLVAAAILIVVGLPPARVALPLGRASSETTPQRGGTLHVATFINVRTLDPALAYDEAALAIGDLIFAKLVTWNERGQLVGDLAREFHASDDGRTYSFTLHPNVVFHDGAKLRAVDVKRSIERTLHPRTPSPGASHFASLQGLSTFRDGKAADIQGIRVTGDLSIEFVLDRPDATFLSLLSLGFAAPVCPSSGSTVDAAKPPKPCGAGPFHLTTWEPEGTIRLERHDAYFIPGRPFLDAIEWLTNERPMAQRYKFETGTLDYVRELGSQDAALYRANPAWSGSFALSASPVINAIFMNTEVAPFDVRAVRRAVALAIDPSVLETVRADTRAIDRVVPESMPGSSRTPMRRHDLEQAREQMRIAGYAFDEATGRGGYPHVIDYVAPADSFEQSAAEIFAQQLARIGIRIRLDLTSYSSYLAKISKRRTAAMGWAGWKADYPDALNFFEPTLSSRAIDDEHSQNYAFFHHDEFDRVLDDASRERNAERRVQLFTRAEEIVRDEAPWAPTHSPRQFELWQPYVRGYVPHPIVPQRFRDVWIDKQAMARSHRRTSSKFASMLDLFVSVRGAR